MPTSVDCPPDQAANLSSFSVSPLQVGFLATAAALHQNVCGSSTCSCRLSTVHLNMRGTASTGAFSCCWGRQPVVAGRRLSVECRATAGISGRGHVDSKPQTISRKSVRKPTQLRRMEDLPGDLFVIYCALSANAQRSMLQRTH